MKLHNLDLFFGGVILSIALTFLEEAEYRCWLSSNLSTQVLFERTEIYKRLPLGPHRVETEVPFMAFGSVITTATVVKFVG